MMWVWGVAVLWVAVAVGLALFLGAGIALAERNAHLRWARAAGEPWLGHDAAEEPEPAFDGEGSAQLALPVGF
jgi:hypothetical protein